MKGIYITEHRLQADYSIIQPKIHTQLRYKFALIWKSSWNLKGSNKGTPGHPHSLLLTEYMCLWHRS